MRFNVPARAVVPFGATPGANQIRHIADMAIALVRDIADKADGRSHGLAPTVVGVPVLRSPAEKKATAMIGPFRDDAVSRFN